MIWHFAEVWLLFVMTFIVGCVLGAFLYGVLADSRFAVAQGIVADGVGDVIDQIKVRLGLGPAWRPKQMTGIARPLPPAVREPVAAKVVPEAREAPVSAHFEEAEPVPAPLPVPREERRPAQREAPQPRRIEKPRPAQPEKPSLRAPAEEPVTPGDPLRLASAMQVGRDGIVPKRPAGLVAPRGGVPDNLTRIKGIGQRNEELLNSLGIFHFGQIAAWTPAESRWIGQYLAFPERIERDEWIVQATMLASGVDTGFEKSAERRRRRRRQDQQELLARQAAAIARNAAEAESALPPEDDLAKQVRAAKRQPPRDDWSADDALAADESPPGDDEAVEPAEETAAAEDLDAADRPDKPPATDDKSEEQR